MLRTFYLAARGLSVSLISLPVFSQAQYASRSGLTTDISAPSPNAVVAPNATFTQDFEGAFPPAGWLVRN